MCCRCASFPTSVQAIKIRAQLDLTVKGKPERSTAICTCLSSMPPPTSCSGSRGYRPDEVNHTKICTWLRGFEVPLPRRRDFSGLLPEFLGARGGKEPTMIPHVKSQLLVRCIPHYNFLATQYHVPGIAYISSSSSDISNPIEVSGVELSCLKIFTERRRVETVARPALYPSFLASSVVNSLPPLLLLRTSASCAGDSNIPVGFLCVDLFMPFITSTSVPAGGGRARVVAGIYKRRRLSSTSCR